MADDKSTLMDRRDENLVEYFIFLPNAELVSIDRLSEIFVYLNSECSLGKYIWQCEAFNLKEVPKSATLPAHLYGRTYFGDNIEDEWYIVYLLLELSKRYADLIVRVIDDDGEFLLIEAADSLPSWLEPSTATNRVFLYQGEVHIVDLNQSLETMDMKDALAVVLSPHETRASTTIHRDIMRKISGYPEKVSKMKHNTNCYIPANLSALLDCHPSLVSSIVCAFYERDDLDLKHCITFKHFQPGTRVMRRVRMTRCLYAQLMQQKFIPDHRSGYLLPHYNSPNFKAQDLGAKLAHGAEILCSTSSGRSQNEFDSTGWSKFFKALTSSGFFEKELEGSQRYNELLSTAKCFFLSSVGPHLIPKTSNNLEEKAEQTFDAKDQNVKEPSSNISLGKGHIDRQHAGDVMMALLKEVDADVEAMRKEAEQLEADDDDGWMYLAPGELEEKLSGYSWDGFQERAGDVLDILPKKVKSFVGQKSSHLGAELPESASEIFFEPDTFMSALQKVFEFDDPNVSSSDSELDEYASEVEEDEDEMALGGKGSRRKGMPPSIKNYMDMMDMELSGTDVGKSFATNPNKKVTNSTSHPGKTSWATWETSNKTSKDNDIKNNKEASKRPANSSTKIENEAATREKFVEQDSEDDSEFEPVDIDMNLVQNLLMSYGAQQGLAGPSSVVLNSLGLNLPPPDF